MNHHEAMSSFYSIISNVQDQYVRGLLHQWAAQNITSISVQYSYDSNTLKEQIEYESRTQFFKIADSLFESAHVKEVKHLTNPPINIITKSLMVIGSHKKVT